MKVVNPNGPGLQILGTICKLPIVFEQDVRHRDFELIGSKKTTRACADSVAEPEMFGTGANQMRFVFFTKRLAHFDVTVRIIFVRFRVNFFVHHDVGAVHGKRCAFFNDEAVAEYNVLKGLPDKECCDEVPVRFSFCVQIIITYPDKRYTLKPSQSRRSISRFVEVYGYYLQLTGENRP